MNSENNDLTQTRPARRPFQYSLRTLFIVTTAVAILCSLVLASPRWVGVGVHAFLAIAVPATLTIMVIYGRGYLRTFAIGALFPAAIMFLCCASDMSAVLQLINYALGIDPSQSLAYGVQQNWDELRFQSAIRIGIGFATTICMGLLAVGVRWLVESPQRWQQQQQASPLDGTNQQSA